MCSVILKCNCTYILTEGVRFIAKGQHRTQVIGLYGSCGFFNPVAQASIVSMFFIKL